MNVQCGSCMGCRYDRAAHWAARIQHEAQSWDHNQFITLTYNDEKMPRLWTNGPGTLIKKHLQDFIKRLRHHFKDTTIRYYACGEYGDNDYRPHYHLAAFNLALRDEQLYSQKKGYPLFVSETLEKIWGNGFATFGELSYESSAYISRYVLKKMTGAKADDHYLRCDDYGVAYWLEPEFNTMSRRPGLGKNWIDNYQDDVYPSDEIPIPGVGIVKGVPRFYDEALKTADPDLYETIKSSRAKYARSHPLEFTPQRLEDKFKCQKALKKHLRRNL